MSNSKKAATEVVAAWQAGHSRHRGHLGTDGVRISTYAKSLAEPVHGEPRAVWFNVRNYSDTSSRHRNAVRAELERAGYALRLVCGAGRWESNIPTADCPPADEVQS